MLAVICSKELHLMQAKKWRGENSEDTCCMCYKDCMPPIVKDGDTLLSARGCILMSP